jgi:hypothetical protein
MALFFFPVYSKNNPDAEVRKAKKGLSKRAKEKAKRGQQQCFLTPLLKTGDKLSNVFCRTMAFSGKDFKTVTKRASGTCIYTVIDNNPLKPVFETYYNYDGAVEGHSKIAVIENGSKQGKPDGKEFYNNTDGSGVMFNSLIWGNPPKQLRKGDNWNVNIAVPWELGGAGEQTIRVLEIDPVNQVIRLEREGTCTGYYDHDLKEIDIEKDGKTLHVQVLPGQSHWKGHTTFKNGLVISDELMVIRPVTLISGNEKFEANEREYILLNEMPELQ